MNIRVVREAGGIGDIVRIIPVLRGLRETYPDARLWVFAPVAYHPLLRGWYDEFIPTPHERRRSRDSELDAEKFPYLNVCDTAAPGREPVKFDVSIDLYCPAFRHEHNQRGHVWLDRIDLFCKAADVGPTTKTPRVNLATAHIAAATEYIRAHHLKGWGRLVALQPFSTDPARNWPVRNFLKLANRLECVGHSVVILDGCKGRTTAFRQHRLLAKPLGFVAAFLAQCDLLIGPDSGLGHLAAAVGTPTVGIFASQSPGVLYRHYPLHTYVYPPWDNRTHCRWPCFWNRRQDCTRAELVKAGRTCPMIARIPVKDVFDAAASRLDADPRAQSPRLALHAMSADAVTGLDEIERIDKVPIPHPDFALDEIALTRATHDLEPVLKEAFRVLKPGGVLYIATDKAPKLHALLHKSGFDAIATQHASPSTTCIKRDTWPRPATRLIPTLTHAAGSR